MILCVALIYQMKVQKVNQTILVIIVIGIVMVKMMKKTVVECKRNRRLWIIGCQLICCMCSIDFRFFSQSGRKKNATTPLKSFLLFFDNKFIELIVRETNRYAEQNLKSQSWKPRSWVHFFLFFLIIYIYIYIFVPTFHC